ncbi:MAG: ribosome silencing factor, partial [Chitinophagia bacterium]|nr:ribosome silencing factor [Chitinophagia bacterium]
METLSVLNGRKKNTITRLNRNSKIIKTIIRAIQNKK